MRKIKLLTLFFAIISFPLFAQTPVDVHGQLSIKGANIVDQNGDIVSFSGPSLYWSNTGWPGAKYYTKGVVDWVKSDWGATIIRAAMGVGPESGAYLTDASNKTRLKTVVDAAIAAGIYVIIDFHCHHAEDYQAQSIAFFKEMATTYGSYPNIIYEIYNEPLAISWNNVLKPYAESVISEIRKIDTKNIVVVGTPNWSQDVDVAAQNPITAYSNIAYTLHFYAGTHTQSLRDKATVAINKGLALIVTEWGSVNADGSGAVATASTNDWLAFMKKYNLTNCNWSICDANEGASALTGGSSTNGNWSDANLTASGKVTKSIVSSWTGGSTVATNPVLSSATITSNGSAISLKFSKPMDGANITSSLSQFSVKINGGITTPLSISQATDNSIFVINLGNSVSYGDAITVSYNGTSVKDATGKSLAAFTNSKVTNTLTPPGVYGFTENFNDNILASGWTNNSNNDFTFTELNQELKISGLTATAGWFPFSLALPVVVNMSTSQTVTIKVKTTSALSLRIDVQDTTGKTTNATEVVKIIATDGAYTTYTYDFTNKFNQAWPNTAVVDRTAINQILFYANPGQTYSGTFTIDDLTIGITPVAVTGVSLNATTLSMNVNGVETLKSTVAPANATNSVTKWSSSNTTIATVSSTGIVTAKAEGTAIITATSSDNASVFATCSLTVKPAVIIIDKSTLVSTIANANAIYTNAVEGSLNGNYPVGSRAILLSEIEKATTVNASLAASQNDVNTATSTLSSAIAAFEASKINIVSVDKSNLESALLVASNLYSASVEGSSVGNYPIGSKAKLQTAIDDAKAVNTDLGANQLKVNTAVDVLNNVVTIFKGSIISTNAVDKTTLIATENAASKLLNSINQGNDVGQYPQIAVETLTKAITAANSIIESTTINQSDVEAANTALTIAVTTFTNSINTDTKNITVLATAILSANALLSQTTVGLENGNVSQSSKDSFIAAITTAETVKNNTSATQADINNAALELEKAITIYTNSKIQTGFDVETYLTISAFPQPVIDVLTITSNGELLKGIKLLSLTGISLIEQEVNAQTVQLSTDGLASGIYVLVIKNATDKTSIVKIVKK